MTMQDRLLERYGKGHLSYSSVKNALADMAQFDRYMKGELKFESPALEFGTLYDMLLFEREKAMDTYVVLSDDRVLERCSDKTREAKKPSMTNEYKEQKLLLAAESEADGKLLCSQSDWEVANKMIERLAECGLLSTYLKGTYQLEFNEDISSPHGPVRVKGFLDCKGTDFITDSKSTMSIGKFRYSVRDFGYDIQAYIYTKVFGVSKFYWVAQEKTYPYLPALVTCSENTLFTGEMKFDDAIGRISKFLDSDESPTIYFEQFEV